MADIKDIVQRREELKTRKSNWEYPFQILGKYIYTRKQQFQQTLNEGSFLNDGMINDSTAVRANAAMASAIMGALWKSGGKTFRIRKPDWMENSSANKKYYKAVNKEIAEAMESPKAGFEMAFHEFLCEEGAFGTSGLALFQGDYQNPLIFKSWSIQTLMVAEGPDGFVDTVYYDERITIHSLVGRYGLKALPKDLQDKYNNPKTKYDKVVLSVGIEPRNEDEQKKGGASDKGMPVASYHFIAEDQAMLKESGYAEMPVRVGRWYKLSNEEYGRSPGMDALPAIMQINAFKESLLVGVEKKVDPPLYVMDDGALGAAVVDTSARGLSVFNAIGRAPGQPPIGQLMDIGELQSVALAIEKTAEEILQHFLIDKLYDLNNKTRMTLGEAEIRQQIRGDALSSIYARHTAEILNPLITRAYNILFGMGILGIKEDDEPTRKLLEAEGVEPIILPPDVVAAIELNRTLYEIDYISPAANVMREGEYQGIIATVNNVIQLAQVKPDVVDVVDTDRVIEYSQELGGAPADIINAVDKIEQIRADRAEAQKAAAEAEMAQMKTQALKNAGQGAQALSAAEGGE